jgi:hypothetical protein
MIPVGVVAGSIVSAVAPGAPTSFTATAASSSSINLSWAAPSSNGGAAITSYTLKRGATTIYTGSGTSFTDTGLSVATAYSYTVLATNIIGNGPTASASATTSANVPSAPTIAVTGSSTEMTDPGDPYEYNETYLTTYTISLSTPDNGGSAITGALFEYSENGGASWTSNFSSPYPSEFTAGFYYGNYDTTPYLVRVRAVNAAGNGAPSNAIQIPVPPPEPPPYEPS